jgi:hypothetical protein
VQVDVLRAKPGYYTDNREIPGTVPTKSHRSDTANSQSARCFGEGPVPPQGASRPPLLAAMENTGACGACYYRYQFPRFLLSYMRRYPLLFLLPSSGCHIKRRGLQMVVAIFGTRPAFIYALLGRRSLVLLFAQPWPPREPPSCQRPSHQNLGAVRHEGRKAHPRPLLFHRHEVGPRRF